MFRECRTRQGLAYGIVTDIGNVAQGRQQTKRLKNAGVDADANAGVALFDSLKSRAGGECSLGDHRHRELPPPPGIVDISAQFA
jgi:hypothetical protein